MLSVDDSDHVDVPVALTHLEGVGFRLQRVREQVWKVADNSTRVSKNCSVIFSLDTVCTSQDIIYGFDKASIYIDEIRSIQRRNSSRTWVVSFTTPEYKDYALEISSATICGCEVFLGDAENKTVIVKIYDAPNELPDTVLIGRLSYYGKVLSFRRDCIALGVYNGVRSARMRLSRPIPSSMRIVGEQVMIFYESQPRTCRRCGGEGHVANGCKAPRCFNCDGAGHELKTAPSLFSAMFVFPRSILPADVLSSSIVLMSIPVLKVKVQLPMQLPFRIVRQGQMANSPPSHLGTRSRMCKNLRRVISPRELSLMARIRMISIVMARKRMISIVITRREENRVIDESVNVNVNVSGSGSVDGSVSGNVSVMTCVAGRIVAVIVIFAPPMTTLTIFRLERVAGAANVVEAKFHLFLI